MSRLIYNSLKRSTVNFPDILFDKSLTQLRYRKKGALDWSVIMGIAMNVPDTDRIVHTVQIEGLTPDTQYEFQVSSPHRSVYLTWENNPSTSMVIHWQTLKPFTKKYTSGFDTYNTYMFKTVPVTLTGSFKVAQISDTHGGGEHLNDVFRRIGRHDTSVIIHGGDIATGNGGQADASTWYGFFDSINYAKDRQGNLIPILVTLGNHETWGGSSGIQYGGAGAKPNFETGQRGDTEWYYAFFPVFPGLKGYGEITFGDYLSIMQIDPGISTLIEGEQTTWITNTLQDKSTIPNKLISLHYGPYPAGRRQYYSYNIAVKDSLVPLWEEHKPVVFSGHDHVWCVSPPIKNGEINLENGIRYLGSGTAGVQVREARNPKTKWWIENVIGTEWKYFDFENANAPGPTLEPREPHVEDGKQFDWKLGSHYWITDCNYNEKKITAYNTYENPFYELVIPNS